MKNTSLIISSAVLSVLLILSMANFFNLRAQENQRILLPIMHANSYYANGQESEPNDNFNLANGPLTSGIDYIGLSDDAYDIYYFDLAEAGLITMRVTNHQVNSGHLLLFQEQAGQIFSIARDDTPPDYHIAYWASEIGRYFLFLSTDLDQPYQTNSPYTLHVTYPVPMLPTSTATPVPTQQSSPTPTNTALPLPSITPTPTALPASPTPNSTQLPTSTATAVSTATPTALPTTPATEPALPPNYLLFDDFDGSTNLPVKWKINGNFNLCDHDQVDGALAIHCETNTNNAQLNFRPKDNALNTAAGIAIAANVSSADWQGELGLGVDIYENGIWTRRYTFELGPDSVEIVENYPQNNWTRISLGLIQPINGATPHILKIEITSDNILFYFDETPFFLQTAPNLPGDMSDRSWLFEGYVLSTGGLLELDSNVYWSAYSN